MANSFTVAFDIGNTLIDVDRIQSQALESTSRALKERGLIKSQVTFMDTYMTAEKSISGPAVNHLFSKPIQIMERALDDLAVTGRSSLYFALSVYRDAVQRRILPKHELTAMLRSIKTRYKLAIISDGSIDDQIRTLYQMGIIELFDPIIISEAVGVLKPDHAIFEQLLSEAGTPPRNVAVVGNDPYRDINGAKQIGMKTVWVRTRGHGQDKAIEESSDAAIDFDHLHLLEPVINRVFGEDVHHGA